MEQRRAAYLAAWDDSHKLVMSGDAKAVIEVGKNGWTLPVPIVKDGAEMALRRRGRSQGDGAAPHRP